MKELLVEFLSLILNEKTNKDEKLVGYGKTTIDGEVVYVYGTNSRPEKERIPSNATHFAKPGQTQNKQRLSVKQQQQILKPSAGKPSGKKSAQTKKPASSKKKSAGGVAAPRGKKVDARTASRSLYGKNGRGRLLIDSPDAQQVLDRGFIAGKGAPPGSAGSNFNENMSDEAACILAQFPDMDDETLARVLFDRVRNTRLAKQQADTSVQGTQTYAPQGTGKKPARIVIPDDITDEQEKLIWKNCVVTARSGRKKYARALRGVQAAQQKGKFGKIRRVRTFGGAAGDLKRAKDTVSSAKKCYVYDNELGLVEVPKEVLIDWINRSGGGKNAADTVVMTVDANGNLIYDGWSDKKTLADIQANSTLNEEYTAMSEAILELEESGGISEKDQDTALTLLLAAQEFSDSLEERYADTSAQMASHFLDEFSTRGGIPPERMQLYLQIINHPDVRIRRSLNLDGHFTSFMKKVNEALKSSGGREIDKKIRELHKEAEQRKLKGPQIYWYVLNKLAESGLLTGNERKILERISSVLVRAKEVTDSGQQLTVGSSLERELTPFLKGVRKITDASRLDIRSSLKTLREETIRFQVEQLEKLNKITVRNSHGDRVRLGDHLEARSIIALLHLDKIDAPSARPGTPEYFEQILVRSTQLMMEGIPVTPETLRECLQVNDTREFEKNFEVVRDPENSNTVFIYALKKGKRVLVARKEYRSKSGATGKTGTVIVWEKDMQKCFDEKGAK